MHSMFGILISWLIWNRFEVAIPAIVARANNHENSTYLDAYD